MEIMLIQETKGNRTKLTTDFEKLAPRTAFKAEDTGDILFKLERPFIDDEGIYWNCVNLSNGLLDFVSDEHICWTFYEKENKYEQWI